MAIDEVRGDGTAGGNGPDDGGPGGPTPSFRISEDVAATIIGLALLALILLGAIPKGILP
jgi:hypothetical protein